MIQKFQRNVEQDSMLYLKQTREKKIYNRQ